MGIEGLKNRANGEVIDESWFGRIRRAFLGVFAPRDVTTLDPLDGAGNLGSASYRWNKAFITSGYWSIGMVKYKYTYTGISGLLEAGWMLCDGSIINEANYNALHGAGKWDADIVSSPLDGLRLPTFNQYVLGTTSATQDGTVAITSEGSTSISGLSHNHNSPVTSGGPSTASTGRIDTGGFADFFTDGAHTHSTSYGNGLSSLSSQRPKSIELNLYMRII